MANLFYYDLIVRAMKTALLVSAPVLIISLTVGFMVSIFQAVTQINDATISFIPKIVAVIVALLIFFPWMLQVMCDFTRGIILGIPMAAGG
ncbi:MAG: flagellar biosynthesis protein FliQ [Nitrospirota bacterium]